MNISKTSYLTVLKIIAAITSVVVLIGSMAFSKDGFSFIASRAWVGIALAITMTILEFIFNTIDVKDIKHDEVLRALYGLGLLGYAYSIFTNILGLTAGRGMTISQLLDSPFILLGFVLMASVMDIAPEKMLIWALCKSGSLKTVAGGNTHRKVTTTPTAHKPYIGNVSNNFNKVAPNKPMTLADKHVSARKQVNFGNIAGLPVKQGSQLLPWED